jgi:solute carrier family 9B (sodium/hydrogen exchanger), member 1/2
MIIFGCLARNFLCTAYMQHYPEYIAGWIRNVCLSVILLRGGLELDFKGKGLTVVLLTLVPQNFEALGGALASRYIFNMPWSLCFAQGYTLGAVSPAVLVPSLMILQKAGYGVKKGIPTTLIAASSFDDIIAITVFSVFLTIAFNEAKGGVNEADAEAGEEENIWVDVGLNAAQIFGGFVVAMISGYCMKIFNQCEPKKTINFKLVFLIVLAMLTPIICYALSVPEAKYVFIIFFGYQCYQQWGEDKPEHELGIFWMFCQPFLFGTVGAAVQFEKLEGSLMLNALYTILLGVSARWIGTIIAAFESKYTCKERMFMAFAWIPKATVQAALGAMVLARAEQENNEEYMRYG